MQSPPKRLQAAIISRLKIMSGTMSIAEKRLPQDGRIQVTVGNRQVDLRVSTVPTTHGESIVMRILDKSALQLGLPQLGFLSDDQAIFEKLIGFPDGILLVTGPTGSGKTTTLYACLNYINRPDKKLITVEDPVEYQMAGINQVQVNKDVGLTFPAVLRALLRQDPDVILVGEIRDTDTAEMAFRAAMTGHQVYSTLHTNSAIGAIPRLLDIGILPDIMAGNIVGVVAQRLVRRLCRHCKEAHPANEVECRIIGVEGGEPPVIHRAVGCEHCEYRGYRGRLAIMEVLKMDFDLDELVARRATTRELTQLALAKGFIPLAEDAVRRVLDGSTTIEEVARVVDFTGRVMGQR
jgi:general secretion pathway protein E/type IV pilus assembly protein PilB